MLIYKKCNNEENLLKIKPLTKEQILISIDRLTRFKNPETKYLRVFKDVITNNLISPKFKKTDLDIMNYSELTNYAQEIINFSLHNLGLPADDSGIINQKLYDYENAIFNLDDNTKNLLKNRINYKACLNLIDDSAPFNLKWLKRLYTADNLAVDRQKTGLKYPLEKIIISEGITEEILLPEFAKIYGYDFDKNGVYVISAGGKNQVVKLFYKLANELKIPIFVLMDNDAQENYKEIVPRLRKFDRVYLLQCGEFEDALPLELIKRTLSNSLKNISLLELEPLNQNTRMVKILEEIFKHRGMHEFKKSEFAQMVKENLRDTDDISSEIAGIIKELKKIKPNSKVVVDN